MRKDIGVAVGLTAGFLWVREFQARRAAERFAAAALETLLRAIDANDADTGRHVRRVANYALILAEAADIPIAVRRNVERVALFHDIGKIHEALFDIVHEESRLTPAERSAIARHPELGAMVLAPLTPFYPELADGVLSHHECWDGSGYPRRLRGDRIPLAARIVAVADTFDAITHSRRYRHGRSTETAVHAIAEARGTQFDPGLVDLLLLPPVLERFATAHRELHAPRPRAAERRRRHEESHVPDVTFRWRESWLGRELPTEHPQLR